MKALLIASVLLFSLRAMSEENSPRANEVQKSDCIFANQEKIGPKVIEQEPEQDSKQKEQGSTIQR